MWGVPTSTAFRGTCSTETLQVFVLEKNGLSQSLISLLTILISLLSHYCWNDFCRALLIGRPRAVCEESFLHLAAPWEAGPHAGDGCSPPVKEQRLVCCQSYTCQFLLHWVCVCVRHLNSHPAEEHQADTSLRNTVVILRFSSLLCFGCQEAQGEICKIFKLSTPVAGLDQVVLASW